MQIAGNEERKVVAVWISILRIIGCALTFPLATVAVLIAQNDQYVRRTWLDEFAGFNRQLIISHLPTRLNVGSGRIVNGKLENEDRAWQRIDPHFLKLPEEEQIHKIESLLRQERSGFPTPALFELRKETSFPRSYELELRRTNKDRWLGMAAGLTIAIAILIQVSISAMALIAGSSSRNDLWKYQEPDRRRIEQHGYKAPRI